MILIEIPENPNCGPVDLRVFHDLEPPRAIRRLRCERGTGAPRWYEVTGWTISGRPCAAQAQKVDDSGEGVAWLLYGGDAGLRFRPAGSSESWRLDNPQQWGESFRLVTEPADIGCAAGGTAPLTAGGPRQPAGTGAETGGGR